MGTDAPPGRFPRTATPALGATKIESAPGRVVVLDVGGLDDVVPPGAKPVGRAPADGDDGIPTYLRKGRGRPRFRRAPGRRTASGPA
ncbi:hypothetical protein [Streptomyces sp. NPDC047434]|uniref:hypothetical protein n=1 Tax=Streptomyces sp. NPDC047434 TaxID=3155143 RepID=UPI0033FA7F37